MKSKIIKRIAGITSIGLAGIITVGTILNHVIPVKAEGTLFGIETLIQEVQNRETPYRILEIVPDEQTAEIGYYIPGYEPVLSTRQAGSGVWSNWEDGLRQLKTAEERIAYMETLNSSLQEFYALRGFGGDNVPVSYQNYAESNEALEDYKELVFDDEILKGYFKPYSGAENVTRYDLNFRFAGNYNEDLFKGELTTQYYYVQDAVQISNTMFDSLTDNTVLYRFIAQVGADRFERVGTWGELKDSILGSVSGGDTDDGDESTESTEETVENSESVEESDENSEAVEDEIVESSEPTQQEIIQSAGEISVSGGDVIPVVKQNVSGGDVEIPEVEIIGAGADGTEGTDTEPEEEVLTDYFLVNMLPWNQEIEPDYWALYVVEEIKQTDDGAFEFCLDEGGAEYSFHTKSIYYKGGFVNNEWFHINVLNRQQGETEQFPMEVLTLTVSELNQLEELPAFDMLYLNSGMQSFVVNADTPIQGYSVDNDISEDRQLRVKLFEDVVLHAKPCIVDGSILYELDTTGKNIGVNAGLMNTNIFRLAAMFLQKSPLAYYNDILLAQVVEPAVVELINGIVDDADRNFVVEQAYCFFAPKQLIGPEFAVDNIYDKKGQSIDGSEKGFEAVLDEIHSENLNREADSSNVYEPLPIGVSQATVVRHIMNYTHRRQIEVKKNIRVLEIQPVKSHADSYDLTEAEIKKWAPKVETVQIDRMTTAEFIGKIEDINEIYDLVYIGTDRDSLNLVSGTMNSYATRDVLYNGDFENGSYNWKIWGTGEVTQNNVFSGSGALKLSSGTITQVVEVEAGATYTLSVCGKASRSGVRGTIGVDLRKGTTSNDNLDKAFELEFTGTEYTQKEIQFTTIPGTTHINVYMWSSGANMYFDNISIKKETLENDAETPGSTVFNDSSMDGLIYFHTGDMRYTSMELAGQLDTEYANFESKGRTDDVYYFNPMRYGGNDITEDKMEALLSFLDASYPIIISDEVFESAATVYGDSNYQGYSVDLSPGRYNMSDLELRGIRNDDISSIKVSEGYQVTFYWDVDFGGTQRVFTADASTLDNNWDNEVTSIVIEAIEGQEALRARKINTDHVDNSSFMHDFIEKAMKYTNFYPRGDMSEDSGMFQFYLNRPKVSITNVIANNADPASGVIGLNPEANNKYMLEYRFTVLNEGAASADTKYECQLYIDVNADGKYSNSEELGDITLTQNGKSVSSTELYAGREYVLRRYVPDGYKGVLPWKIQISQVNNKNIHNGVTGYTKLRGLDSETLKILQICRDQVTEVDWWDGANEVMFNLEERIADPTDIYHILIYGGDYAGEHYEGISNDFDIDVDFMKISEFEKAYAEAENPEEFMNNYNMLILGFSDAYGNISGDAESGPISAIIDFINGGKSVLFAHDSVSYFSYEKQRLDENGNVVDRKGVVDRYDDSVETKITDQYHNSYNLSKHIRGMVGMDRYGIMTVEGLKEGKNLTAESPSWKILKELGKEMAYLPKSNKTVTTGLTQGYTYSIINAKDINETGGRHESFTNAQTGNGSFTNEYLNLDFNTVYYHDNSADDGEIKGSYNAEVSNLWVTKVNSGQITDYPYELKDEFMVSNTHAQYYQLDFTADDDDDDQSDLVVWYCLGHRTNAKGEKQETIYSMSPNDVSNNYYIYNKGNITYTGVGHAGNTTTVDEAKLFINTMIASYNAGIKDPTVSVLSDGSGNASEIDTFYTYYDGENNLTFDSTETTKSTQEGKKKLFFTVSDPNFVKGERKISVRCYYEMDAEGFVGSQDIVYQGKTVTVAPFDMVSDSPQLEVYNASTNRKADINNLTSGGIYYILFDDSVMGDYESRFSVYFEVQSTINTYKNVIQTEKSYGRFNYTKVRLFDLQ